MTLELEFRELRYKDAWDSFLKGDRVCWGLRLDLQIRRTIAVIIGYDHKCANSRYDCFEIMGVFPNLYWWKSRGLEGNWALKSKGWVVQPGQSWEVLECLLGPECSSVQGLFGLFSLSFCGLQRTQARHPLDTISNEMFSDVSECHFYYFCRQQLYLPIALCTTYKMSWRWLTGWGNISAHNIADRTI